LLGGIAIVSRRTLLFLTDRGLRALKRAGQKSKQRYIYFVKHYKTNACCNCPALALCTKNKKGRLLERSEYQSYIEQNKKNIEAGSGAEEGQLTSTELLFILIPGWVALSSFLLGALFLGRIAFHIM